jgi:hypothetical protein
MGESRVGGLEGGVEQPDTLKIAIHIINYPCAGIPLSDYSNDLLPIPKYLPFLSKIGPLPHSIRVPDPL